MRWAEYIARIGRIRNACSIFACESEGKRQLGRPRCRCENKIRRWIMAYVAQGREWWLAFVNTVMKRRVLKE